MNGSSARGFTLLEILITLLLTGIMMSAIHQLYLNTQGAALVQEEVVELQQNLRIAMERLARDLRMAGFLVPTTYPPLRSAPHHPVESDPLTLHTACPSGRSAPLGAAVRARASLVTFPLTSSAMVDLFAVDDRVRLIRPLDRSQPLDKCLRVASRSPTSGTITLEGFDPAAVVDYQAGDVLALAATQPGTIEYYLKDFELFTRHSDGVAQRITAKKELDGTLVNGLTAFELAYVMADGAILDTAPVAERDAIRAVRVTLTGQVRSTQGNRVRSLRKVIALRNR